MDSGPAIFTTSTYLCDGCDPKKTEIAPFALTSYDEVVGWAEMIAEVVRLRRMPPWHANPKHGSFRNERFLTDEETARRVLGGLEKPTAGTVRYRGTALQVDDDAELTRFRRRHVGFVFQFYNLIPTLTAEENVALITDIAESGLRPAEALDEDADEAPIRSGLRKRSGEDRPEGGGDRVDVQHEDREGGEDVTPHIVGTIASAVVAMRLMPPMMTTPTAVAIRSP